MGAFANLDRGESDSDRGAPHPGVPLFIEPGLVLDGRFRIVRSLGSGGMGSVWLAEQLNLDRLVAVKLLCRDHLLRDPRLEARFFHEARRSSRLCHPNTVRVYDYGRTSHGVHYIVMEFLPGETLRAVLHREGHLPPSRAARLAGQICASLGEAHDLGLIHRDVKPSNLLVTCPEEGAEVLRVLDFGIAKDLHSDEKTLAGLYGSPGYMSPEQLLEQPVTTRSDIYCVGAVLYEMLTGARPYGSASSIAMLARPLLQRPIPFAEANPSNAVPAPLEQIVMRCLERDPQDRFATVRDLGLALAAWQSEGVSVVSAAQGVSVVSHDQAQAPPPDEVAPTGRVPGWPLAVTVAVVTAVSAAPVMGFVVLVGVWLTLALGALHREPPAQIPDDPSVHAAP